MASDESGGERPETSPAGYTGPADAAEAETPAEPAGMAGDQLADSGHAAPPREAAPLDDAPPREAAPWDDAPPREAAPRDGAPPPVSSRPSGRSLPPPGMILAAGIMIGISIMELGFWIPDVQSDGLLPHGSWMDPAGLQAIRNLITALLAVIQIVIAIGLFFRPRWVMAALAAVLAHGLVWIGPSIIEVLLDREASLEWHADTVRSGVWETVIVFALLFGGWIALRRRRGRPVRISLGRSLMSLVEGIAASAFIGASIYLAYVIPRQWAAFGDGAADALDALAQEGHGDFVPADLLPDVDATLFRNRLEAVSGDTKPVWENGAPATLVDFWASWCAPCLIELPHLQELQERVEKQGMRVVLVNVDLGDARAAGRFLQRRQIRLDSLVDRDGVLFQALGLSALPSSFVLDAKGHPVAFFEGVVSRQELEAALLRANDDRVRNTFR